MTDSTYTTILGDTWDGMAYKLFGDEAYMGLLLEENPQYRDVLVFSAGTVLDVPELEEPEVDEELPIWRQLPEDDEDDTDDDDLEDDGEEDDSDDESDDDDSDDDVLDDEE